MLPLSDTSVTLFLALAARYVGNEPMVADAAALCAGRTRGWSTWYGLSEPDQLVIAESLRLRPSSVAQPKTLRYDRRGNYQGRT